MNEKVIIRVQPELMELIPKFMESRRSDVSRLAADLDSGNFPDIRLMGHKMKGFGSSYGFHLITEIGAMLEDAAAQEKADVIRSQIDRLGKYIDAVEIQVAEDSAA